MRWIIYDYEYWPWLVDNKMEQLLSIKVNELYRENSKFNNSAYKGPVPYQTSWWPLNIDSQCSGWNNSCVTIRSNNS